ncbi:hypothetical protein [Leptospira sanjuanensis]|uniref:hypothetical protein n=1 Tax=Leptospira sanjuanensis TaxID=2879643 RepID=UPI001EE891C2|nr:hypothetical protein [Leptospira sanjuanensis]MCG6170235.1 hypothetical protein [Leptospira sanjuanensis]
MADTVFLHPFQILKATPEDRTGAIKILVKASTEREDRQGETILKSAYADQEMRKDFCEQGYFDYNHLTDYIEKEISTLKREGKLTGSLLVDLEKSKTEAIIGSPEQIGLRDDFPQHLGIKDEGLYIQGRLFPGNKFAEEIRKGLQAGFNGWGASVSGRARPQDFNGKTIRKLFLKKCAIAPLAEVINPDTSVQLLKGAVFLKDIEKSMSSSMQSDLEILEEPEFDRFVKIERTIAFLTKLIQSDPAIHDRYINLIFSDFENRIKNLEQELRSSWVKSILANEYYIEGDDLESLSDLLFLKLNEDTECSRTLSHV